MGGALAVRTTRLAEVDRRFTWVGPLREAVGGAQFDDAKRTARVIIITEGLGNLRDKNYYTKEAIQSCPPVFDGAQFYIDHPSTVDDEVRPERTIRDLGGYFSDPKIGTFKDQDTGEVLEACFATVNCSASDPGRLAYEQIKTAIEYQRRYPNSKNVYCGISINGNGASHPGTIRGMAVNMVTAIREAFSADIVTKPARGGRFLSLVQESEKARLRLGRMRAQQGHAREGHMRHGRSQGRIVVTAKDRGRVRESAVILFSEVKQLGRKVREALQKAKDHKLENLERKVREGSIDQLKAAGTKYSKLKRAAEDAGAQVNELLMDIQQDIGELSKALGLGGGADDGGDVGGDMADERMAGEDEGGEEEGEGRRRAGEDEGGEEEGEGRRRAGEDEGGEEEGEGRRRAGEDEGRRRAGEDEEEGEGGEEEDEGYGMGGEDEGMPGPMMAYDCEACGAENKVRAPKGFKLVADEAARRAAESNRRLERRIDRKEGRFVDSNTKHAREMATLRQDNSRLARENQGMRNVLAAQRVLRENRIPRDLLKWEQLVTYPRAQWEDRIEQALRQQRVESRVFSRTPAGRGQGGLREATTETREADATKVIDKHFPEAK